MRFALENTVVYWWFMDKIFWDVLVGLPFITGCVKVAVKRRLVVVLHILRKTDAEFYYAQNHYKNLHSPNPKSQVS